MLSRALAASGCAASSSRTTSTGAPLSSAWRSGVWPRLSFALAAAGCAAKFAIGHALATPLARKRALVAAGVAALAVAAAKLKAYLDPALAPADDVSCVTFNTRPTFDAGYLEDDLTFDADASYAKSSVFGEHFGESSNDVYPCALPGFAGAADPLGSWRSLALF